jgi:hypothetical protein
MSSGVSPFLFLAVASAPRSRSRRARSTRPQLAASSNGVHPTSSWAFTSTLCSRSRCATSPYDVLWLTRDVMVSDRRRSVLSDLPRARGVHVRVRLVPRVPRHVMVSVRRGSVRSHLPRFREEDVKDPRVDTGFHELGVSRGSACFWFLVLKYNTWDLCTKEHVSTVVDSL